MTARVEVDVFAKDNASRTFSRVGSSAEHSGGMVRKFGVTLAGVFTGAALYNGARDLVRVMGEVADSAIEDQAAAKRMALQFRNSADATSSQVSATEDWIAAQGKALGVADDELRPALTKLVAVTHDVGDAQRDTMLALDASASTGKEFSSVVDAMVKAENGSVGGLGRLGVATKDAEGKTKALNAIQKDMAATFKGQASAAADTAAGKYQRLQVEFHELEEELGYKLLPVINEFGDWVLDTGVPAGEKLASVIGDRVGPVVRDMRRWFADNQDELEDFARTTGTELVNDLAAVAQVGGQVVRFFSTLPDPVKHAAIEVGIAVVAFRELNSITNGMNFAQYITNVRNAETRTKALGTAARTAAGIGGLALLADSTQRSNQGLRDLEQVAGGAAAGFALGGPIGAGVGALAGAIGAVATSTDQAKDSFHLAKPEAADFADTLNKVSGAATSASRHTAALALQEAGAFDAARDLGLSQRDLVKYVMGNEGAIKRVNKALQEGQSDMLIWTDQWGVTHSLLAGNAQAAQKLSGILHTNAAALDEDARKAQELSVAAGDLEKALKGVKDRGKIVTSIETNGYPETKRELAELIRTYGLTPKQIKTLIQATGVDASVAGVQRVIDRLNNVHDKTVTLTVKTNRIGGVTSSGGGHSAPDPEVPSRPHGKTVGGPLDKLYRMDGSYSGLPGGPTLSAAGADLIESLVKGIDKGRKPLNRILTAIHNDVQNKLDFRNQLQAAHDQFAAGFDFRESVFGMSSSEDQPLTLATLLGKAATEKAKAAQVDADVQRLLQLGLSEDEIRQFQAQGAAGAEALHVLAGATADQIAQLNADNQAALDLYTHAGMAAADKQYNASISAANAQLALAQNVEKVAESVRDELGSWAEQVRFVIDADQLVAVIAKDKKHKGKQ